MLILSQDIGHAYPMYHIFFFLINFYFFILLILQNKIFYYKIKLMVKKEEIKQYL